MQACIFTSCHRFLCLSVHSCEEIITVAADEAPTPVVKHCDEPHSMISLVLKDLLFSDVNEFWRLFWEDCLKLWHLMIFAWKRIRFTTFLPTIEHTSFCMQIVTVFSMLGLEIQEDFRIEFQTTQNIFFSHEILAICHTQFIALYFPATNSCPQTSAPTSLQLISETAWICLKLHSNKIECVLGDQTLQAWSWFKWLLQCENFV